MVGDRYAGEWPREQFRNKGIRYEVADLPKVDLYRELLLGDIIKRMPSAAFNKFVETHVQAYLDGKAPPAAIQSAVMNIADDYVAGKDIAVKAGDYIALQNQFRK